MKKKRFVIVILSIILYTAVTFLTIVYKQEITLRSAHGVVLTQAVLLIIIYLIYRRWLSK